ncbi:uncharacterized protein TRIADDRAFT_54278 [Trichoplax adhaerens]|uniref:RRM domain-containing protein n=1 Tax=Trichoplax adhaerens TaxID=10228 RepID=B3RRK7_TRIAD|nr:hypothetical protein TRIADDRAFT_54278 [Trichoplax adhaerens]EDV26365.1 hypothetical protein TRIADDRAFT_54278 [Trichoplax adhaerens]|eukprot:XP_002110361.1 hypothetical protein TRIADDRAFT_54278 [Trichoplax adhaerens]
MDWKNVVIVKYSIQCYNQYCIHNSTIVARRVNVAPGRLVDSFSLAVEQHIKKNREGYVSITLITSFKKVKCLTRDWNIVAEALKYSQKLEVNQEGKKVKRKDPLPEYLKIAAENKGIKTVVAYNLPPKYSNISGVSNLFSTYGEILLARIIRPNDNIPDDLKPAKAYHSQLGQETCAFVEFDKPEHALRCIEGLTQADRQDLDGIGVTLLNLKIKQSTLDKIKEMEAKAKSDSASQDEKEKKSKRKKKKNKRLDELLNVRDDVSTCSSDDAEGAPRRRSAPIPIGKDSSKGTLGPDRGRRFDSPRGNSPRNSSDSWKRSDYSSDSCAHSPWSRRPRSDGGSPRASPLPPRRSFSRTNKIQMEGVIRPPIGPDGTRGFKIGRGINITISKLTFLAISYTVDAIALFLANKLQSEIALLTTFVILNLD